eukprot:scaffold7387_cov231-Pinguiococcus_pyrenoidosus.AAC.3
MEHSQSPSYTHRRSRRGSERKRLERLRRTGQGSAARQSPRKVHMKERRGAKGSGQRVDHLDLSETFPAGRGGRSK